jgi:hypothetical protein
MFWRYIHALVELKEWQLALSCWKIWLFELMNGINDLVMCFDIQ